MRFVAFAKGYYSADTFAGYKAALGTIRKLYGHTAAKEFGPLALKAVRSQLVAAGLARPSVNKRVAQVVRFFKWCASEELVPAGVFELLRTVEGLRAGRSAAREPDPVRPPDPAHVSAALPRMPAPVRALAELQLLTAARPGELVGLKPVDIDRTGDVWVARLAAHKTAHKGKERVLYSGPMAQALLAPWLLKAGDGHLFCPAAAERERNAARGEQRVTPKYPSHMRRNERKRAGAGRRRMPGEHYTVGTYRQAIERACERAGVAARTPHQLRHAAATEIRREFGVEVARIVLGHATTFTTEIYAEADRGKALDAMKRAE